MQLFQLGVDLVINQLVYGHSAGLYSHWLVRGTLRLMAATSLDSEHTCGLSMPLLAYAAPLAPHCDGTGRSYGLTAEVRDLLVGHLSFPITQPQCLFWYSISQTVLLNRVNYYDEPGANAFV
jgi:hypothetical protein